MNDRVKLKSGDVTLSALVTGKADGPTILLSNSLGAGLDMWEPQRAMLGRHYRVIGYDTRGHGQSSTPVGDYSFDNLTDDALAVLNHFEVQTADYIGLSLGGMSGLGLGLHHADRFGKIVCACARADAPQPFADSWDDRIAAIATGGLSAIWPGTLERWLTPTFAQRNQSVVADLASDFVQTTPAGYTQCARALQDLDYKRHLTGMNVPVLYISGTEDLGAPPAEMQAMWISTPGSEYINITDCAHIANLNQSGAFNAALQKFLEI
ncbi:MAG: 3-oxoadipate enol-lactonase [Yoonia sp.]|jgi:3-oxoadipate enol-lactonase